MVMEFLTGEDLSTRLARDKRLDVGTALVVASQVLRGLGKAHAAGVVHRDLKPANIFLLTREDGTILVKVLDFGISKLLSDEQEQPQGPAGSKLTRMGSVIGTPQYMSPEQAQGLPTVDHRADVWAFGAVFYECLAGRTAFEEGATYEQTIIRIVTTRPPQLADVAPWVPAPLAAAVHRALEPDLGARFADCAAFLRAVQEAMPQLSPDGSGRLPSFGGDSNPGMLGQNPANLGTLPSASGSGRQVVTPATGGPMTAREALSSTMAADSISGLLASRPATITGNGVMVRAPGSTLASGEGDDPVDIPGVGRGKKSSMMMVGVVFAVATIGGLAIGGIAVMKNKSEATSVAPHGLVAVAQPPVELAAVAPVNPPPLIAPPPSAEPAPAPAPSTKPVAAIAASPKPAPAAPKAGAARPAGAPAARAEPASGGAFGGVKVSDDY